MPKSTVYISVPTWANHHNIWRDANVPQKSYRYYNPATRGLDFDGFMEDVKVGTTRPTGPLADARLWLHGRHQGGCSKANGPTGCCEQGSIRQYWAVTWGGV